MFTQTSPGNQNVFAMQYPDSPHRLSGLVKEIFIARGWIRKTIYGSAEQYQITTKGARFLLHDIKRFGNEIVL